jgi:hypothetical protein
MYPLGMDEPIPQMIITRCLVANACRILEQFSERTLRQFEWEDFTHDDWPAFLQRCLPACHALINRTPSPWSFDGFDFLLCRAIECQWNRDQLWHLMMGWHPGFPRRMHGLDPPLLRQCAIQCGNHDVVAWLDEEDIIALLRRAR